ncbi:MAG: hypothetical protein CSA62_09990 [Planctomycetota bacterium]|nr:MAG: hypothetical protein CSA62_09990 [Planctomycetota bacterium]
MCRSWLEESVCREFLERCPEGEHILLERGNNLLRWVSRSRPHGFEIDLVLNTGSREHAFQAELAMGRLPDCFAYAFVSESPPPPGFLSVRRGNVACFDSGLARPLAGCGWPEQIPLHVSRLLRCSGVSGWRLADELPIRYLGKASAATDYELFASDEYGDQALRPIRSDESEVCVNIPGNLWLGRPGKRLELDLGGRTLLLFVEGQLYLAGDVRPRGVRDRLVIVAGKEPGAEASVNLGLPGRPAPLELELCLVSRGALRVYARHSSLRGHLMVEGPVLIEEPGAKLELIVPGSESGELRPLPNLPTAPGSRQELRLLRLESLS